MKKYSFFLVFLAACSMHKEHSDHLASIHIVDRNGFTETLSGVERLAAYEKVNFLEPQPYQKVQRTFHRNAENKNISLITSYHPNGHIWQYLETLDGRAHGLYREWHPNGILKLEAHLLEGAGDLHPLAHASWVFDGTCLVFDEEENKIAEFFYTKGALSGTSRYYHPNGKVWKELPYKNHALDGFLCVYDESGFTIEHIPYQKDIRHGRAYGLWTEGKPQYEEEYVEGLLMRGEYFDAQGKLIAQIEGGMGTKAVFKEGTAIQIVEYQQGVEEGRVKILDKEGNVKSFYTIKNGVKNGEEWEYYAGSQVPKLLVIWQDDKIQGTCKTWYPQGNVESQKEMHNNLKHGLSFAWYASGDLMLMEEYDLGLLVRGSYFKKGDKYPVSKVERGEGVATLHTAQGAFLQKIPYEKGVPLCD